MLTSIYSPSLKPVKKLLRKITLPEFETGSPSIPCERLTNSIFSLYYKTNIWFDLFDICIYFYFNRF